MKRVICADVTIAKAPLRASRLTAFCGFAILVGVLAGPGCGGGAASFLGGQDREITAATQALETARDDAQRAKAFSTRGAAYSEKARYSRIQKLISTEEYERLFGLAITDHDQAVALSPSSAEVFFNRAQAYYDRGSGDLIYATDPYAGKPRNNRWLTAAAADFEKSVERDPKNSLTFDRLGLAYESNGEPDKAIQAYTRELALDSHLGKLRLADAYCVIGYERQLQKDYHDAVEAYRKSTEFGTADDKTCPVEPSAAIAEISKSGVR